MSARLRNIWESLGASYWFLPSIMAFMALVLGGIFVWLDAGPAAALLDGIGWYQKVQPDGAHQVLSTIAGSMITVAGVTFSITIVAIAFAAQQYGPRLLTNFMSDRGNQVTLGTFIATFVYCLVVLRTIRGGDDDTFVPQMAVLFGLGLALCSIVVLIFFIHHVPESIHINNVAARVGKRLIEAIPEQFPKGIGDPAEPGAREPDVGTGCAILACDTGYIRSVNDEALMRVACKHDLVVQLHHRPGDFIHRGRVLVDAAPVASANEAAEALRSAYSVGAKRTPADDLDFLVSELVEIATRALSTGVNDPATAITCMDWLGAGASTFAQRQLPSPRRSDPQGVVRVIAQTDDFRRFADRAFGRLRQYVAGDTVACSHMLSVLAAVLRDCRTSEQQAACKEEAVRLIEAARAKLDPVERQSLTRQIHEMRADGTGLLANVIPEDEPLGQGRDGS